MCLSGGTPNIHRKGEYNYESTSNLPGNQARATRKKFPPEEVESMAIAHPDVTRVRSGQCSDILPLFFPLKAGKIRSQTINFQKFKFLPTRKGPYLDA